MEIFIGGAGWREGYQKRYYIQYIDYYYDENGKYKGKTILLHKFLMNVWDKRKVGHIDHDSLNNTKINLRVISNSKNLQNRKGKNSNNKSGYRNVFWNSQIEKWSVRLCKDYKTINLGDYDNVDEAGKVAKEGRGKYFGEFQGEG